jgi:hypothetical protein
MGISVKHQWGDNEFSILGTPPTCCEKARGQTEGRCCELSHSNFFPILSPESPKVSLTPAPLVWAAPGKTPPELLCHVNHFYPSEGLEVEWELRGGPEGGSRKAEGQKWLSSLRHHSDGSVSLLGYLQPPPVTTEQHGARYACRVYHSSLPASGRSVEVTLEVVGKNQKCHGAGGGGGTLGNTSRTLTPSTF